MINQVIQGDCLELSKQLEDKSIDACVIDPPYGEGFEYDGDENIGSAKELLNSFLELVAGKLKENAHLAIFWTMRNLDVCIDAVRQHFTFRRVVSMYLPKGSARPYLGWLPRTQAIVIAQKYVTGQPSDFHWELSEYLKAKMEEADQTRSKLAKILGCDSRLVMKWTRPGDWAWCLPTPRFYKPLKELLRLDDRYDFLLTREPSHGYKARRDFAFKHDCYVVDDKNEKMEHPAQKPLSVVTHLVECVTPKGGVVLDAFAGSGTTALAALATDRNFICFEVSEQFCDVARRRIAEWHDS
jgi:site-specific DNA-methyltransferase (adenine-specific)